MVENNQFLFKWKSIHEKGIFSFVIPFISGLVVGLILMIVVFYLAVPDFSLNNLYFAAKVSIFTVLVAAIVKIFEWNKGEKRFKEINKISEEKKES